MPRIAALVLVVARERVAQLQKCRGAKRQVVGDQDVAAVGDVLRVVQVPHVAECVEGRDEEAVEGEAAEDALLLALRPIHADIETLRRGRIETGKKKIVDGA